MSSQKVVDNSPPVCVCVCQEMYIFLEMGSVEIASRNTSWFGFGVIGFQRAVKL